MSNKFYQHVWVRYSALMDGISTLGRRLLKNAHLPGEPSQTKLNAEGSPSINATTRQDVGSVSSEKPWFVRLFSGLWPPLPSHLPHYLLALLAGFACWRGHSPVTVVARFELPSVGIPFTGEIVANAVRDALNSTFQDIKSEKNDESLRPTEMDLPILRELNVPQFSAVQDGPTHFDVEIKGMSYTAVVAAARAIWSSETRVSGDVVLNAKSNELTLIARTSTNSWQSIPSPATAEGLKRASRDLAVKILETQNPTLAGAALLKDGQIERAVSAFERAKRTKPTDVTANLNLCMGYEASHRYSDAIKCYRHVENMKPDSPDAVSEHRVHAQYLNGERKKAIDAFGVLVKNGHNSALLELGKALEDTADHKGALENYNKYLARTGEDNDHELAVAHLNIGAAYAHQMDHESAIDEYKKALEHAPGDVLVQVNLAVETAESGEVDAGIAQLKSLVRENANQDSIPFAYMQLGNLMATKKHDWRSATEQYRKATESRPNYDEAHRRLASSLAHQGFLGSALAEYFKVAKLSPLEPERRNASVLANQWLGNALSQHRKYRAAASFYREALRLKPNYHAAQSELGYVLERQGHLKQAIRQYRVAADAKQSELDDDNSLHLARVRLVEALVSQRQTRRMEAIAELRKLMELDVKDLECRFCLAKALLNEGKYIEATTEYQAAIELNPQSAAAHHGLAYALHKQHLLDQAIGEYRRAVSLEPGNPLYHISLANELEIAHLNQEAAAEREKITRLKLQRSASDQTLRAQLDRPPRCH